MRGTARTVAGMLFAATLAGLGHRVLRITPAAELAAAAGRGDLQRRRRRRATASFAAPPGRCARVTPPCRSRGRRRRRSIPWVDGERVLPADHGRRRGRPLLGPHPHVRLA